MYPFELSIHEQLINEMIQTDKAKAAENSRVQDYVNAHN